MGRSDHAAGARWRLYLTRRWPVEVVVHLADRFEVVVNDADTPLSRAGLKAAMREFDVLCPTVSDQIDADVLLVPGRRVQLIANYGAGVNHIDLEAAKKAGLQVSNTPDVLTDVTAELAILLMLMISRRAGEGERLLRGGEWTGWRPTGMLGQSLEGACLGLVGFGRIGRATAAKARAMFGMDISYYAPRRAAEAAETMVGVRYCPSLAELVGWADVLSLHCPAQPATRHMIDRDQLGRMKPGAILINTARGSLVDEAALAAALTDGVIAGAGLARIIHERSGFWLANVA